MLHARPTPRPAVVLASLAISTLRTCLCLSQDTRHKKVQKIHNPRSLGRTGNRCRGDQLTQNSTTSDATGYSAHALRSCNAVGVIISLECVAAHQAVALELLRADRRAKAIALREHRAGLLQTGRQLLPGSLFQTCLTIDGVGLFTVRFVLRQCKTGLSQGKHHQKSAHQAC